MGKRVVYLRGDCPEWEEAEIVFVTPERLATESGQQELRLMLLEGVAAIAVDEAHCLCEWGLGFRPSYLKMGEVVCRAFAELRSRGKAEASTDLCHRDSHA